MYVYMHVYEYIYMAVYVYMYMYVYVYVYVQVARYHLQLLRTRRYGTATGMRTRIADMDARSSVVACSCHQPNGRFFLHLSLGTCHYALGMWIARLTHSVAHCQSAFLVDYCLYRDVRQGRCHVVPMLGWGCL